MNIEHRASQIMNELSSHNTGAGKGDKDRSPGWRENYPEIQFDKTKTNEGFIQTGPNRFRKVYGPRTQRGVEVATGSGITECYCSLTGEIKVCALPDVPQEINR